MQSCTFCWTPAQLFISFSVGSEVVVVKSGKRICGTGAAFSNAPIVQDKAYFEIKLQSTGIRYSLLSPMVTI